MKNIKNVILCTENVWKTLKNGDRSKEIDFVITDGSVEEMAALIAKYDPIMVIADGSAGRFKQYALLAKTNGGTRFVMLADKEFAGSDLSNVRFVDPDDYLGLENIIREIELKNIACKVRYEEKYAELADQMVRNTLGKLGFRLKSKGTLYLHEIVTMMLNGDIDESASVVKETYPEIAKRNNTTAEAVERSVRVAINNYWDISKCVECLGIIAEPLAENGIIPDNKETILNICSSVSEKLRKKSGSLRKELVEEMVLT